MKVKTSVAIDEELLNWIDGKVKTKVFANRSHAVEYAIHKLKESIE